MGPAIIPQDKAKTSELAIPIPQKDDEFLHKGKSDLTVKVEDKDGTMIKDDMGNHTYVPIDMTKLISQITVKVPLLEMMRIKEHKVKALDWVNGVPLL